MHRKEQGQRPCAISTVEIQLFHNSKKLRLSIIKKWQDCSHWLILGQFGVWKRNLTWESKFGSRQCIDN